MIYDERFFDDMSHAIDCHEESVISDTLSGLNNTFVEVVEKVFESESDFVTLLGLLHKIVASDEYADDAKRLRSFLQEKIEDYARLKASEEINKLFWRKKR
jgi:hypothetical protein